MVIYIVQILNNKIILDWRNKWIDISNSMEKLYLSVKGKYNLLDESIDYYMSMLEFSIYCLKDYDNYYDYAAIQKDKNNSKIDIKERFFAEYLKDSFFNNNCINIKEIISMHSEYNYDLVIARMIFPNYYFNLFYDITVLGIEEKEIIPIISRIKDYEKYLNNIISQISELYKIKKYQFDT